MKANMNLISKVGDKPVGLKSIIFLTFPSKTNAHLRTAVTGLARACHRNIHTQSYHSFACSMKH